MESNDMDIEIDPCPFCGGTETEEVMNDNEAAIECLACFAHGPWVDSILEDPIEAWNSRGDFKSEYND